MTSKKKLHILFLSSWYPSKVLPTNGDFVQRHAEAVATKQDVTLIHAISDATLKKKTEIFRSTVNNVKTIIIYIKPIKNPIVKFFTFLKIYNSEVKKIGAFDLVHLNITFPKGIIALYLKWFYHKKYIITEHWTGYHKPQVVTIGFFRKLITKLIVKKASFICPVSYNLQQAMSNFGLQGNYQIIPNVVDTKMFKPLPKNNSVFTIIHISSMVDAHKNISGILKVLKKLEDYSIPFTCKFIGEDVEDAKKKAKKIGVNLKNTTFIGHMPQQELIKHLQVANVFVLFSNYENLPCVILESFSCGVPVISTNIGGISECFPKEFGFLIEPKNETQLLEKIIDLYNNPISLSEKMHQYAHTNFSKESICEQYTNLYYKTLEINA